MTKKLVRSFAVSTNVLDKLKELQLKQYINVSQFVETAILEKINRFIGEGKNARF